VTDPDATDEIETVVVDVICLNVAEDYLNNNDVVTLLKLSYAHWFLPL
jgi:ATP:corrinoid adenosyltransferase